MNWAIRSMGALAAALVATGAPGEVRNELGDLAARIDYGYYSVDASLIAAARTDLAQLPSSDPLVRYYRGYAALRLAQTRLLRDAEATVEIEPCFEDARAATQAGPTAGEAWILLAACSLVAADREPLKAVLHNRRFENALDNARATAGRNPRLLLLEAWRVERDAGRGQAYVALLAEARAAVESEAGPDELPDWGEAEILARLAEHYLAAGDRRQARDYVERALFVAPDFEAALETRRRLRAETP